MAQNKTLAMRLLEGKKVSYEAISYDASERDAEKIAVQLGVPPEQVFKTLVVAAPQDGRSSSKPFLVVIPANRQLDLKKVAAAIGEKKLGMASHAEAESLTHLQVGSISALALLNRGFEIYIDESALTFEQIYVSGGQRGLDVKVAVADLLRITGAQPIPAV